MECFLNHPDQHFGGHTYAQHGDDLMILNIFKLMKIQKPSYLDLGAHHPFVISNTALLYKTGSRGVNVEANKDLVDLFNTYRPEDKNVHCGVGAKAGIFPFYKYSNLSGRNTFSLDETERMKGKMTIKNIESLLVLELQEILETYCDGIYPDLLSTDIEGLDYEVLRSAKFTDKNSPKLIVTETRLEDAGKVKRLLFDRDYFCYCRMGENLFFIQQKYEHTIY